MKHGAIALLGLVTIVAYGSWYYAFGVLLDPIRIATGWSEAGLAASFSAGIVSVGFGAIGGGRLLDRLGSRFVFLIGGTGGGLGLLATSYSSGQIMFTVAAAAAMGFLGSFGFYHITMTTAVRVNPQDPSKAIATLTIWGAFASVIYLPATAALVEWLEWRLTVRILGLVVLAIFGMAALVIPNTVSEPETGSESGTGSDGNEPRPSIRQILAATVQSPSRRSFTIAVAFGGVAMSTVLVYQVPTMTAVGLPLSTAATMAGIRGFAQTGGRIPLGRIVKRVGSDGALVLAFSAMTIGGTLLAFAGTVPVALAFAIIMGFGIGAYSPLQGIKAEELFERETLGATMGAYSTIMMLSGAAGPAVAGVLADSTDDRRMVAFVIVGAAAVATLFALRLRRSTVGIPSPPVDGVA
ncbi:MAG: MFS transporter [Acidimicrobiales bacterium]